MQDGPGIYVGDMYCYLYCFPYGHNFYNAVGYCLFDLRFQNITDHKNIVEKMFEQKSLNIKYI